MKIDKNTINKIARLSRIKLDDKESEDYIKDLNSILDWVEQLNEVNTENVEPLSNISSSILPKREDISKDTNTSEEILENAPDKLEGFFAVPKVVE
ncbi:Asp-tRNA(Asn)/Glu-tRNA(Gln) amidotransferase subunit GatC [Pelagibacteraceae bacterium]|nr:Asp-tRNA(Asn)/Glu-tRNA(Gln) amidotransferase subunit GatC [Pelagibacteraceae bacterium]